MDRSSQAKQFWDTRYAEADRIWSGRVNAALSAVAGELEPGRALDLGCGEGGDSLWLAGRGWNVTGVDISTTALDRARVEAEAAGLDVEWVAADLTVWSPSSTFDLVSACFMQSPIELPRHAILRRIAGSVTPGGRLLVVGHSSAPTWAVAAHEHEGRSGPDLLDAAAEAAALALPADEWSLEVCQDRPRVVTGPGGAVAEIHDAVIVARRSASPPRG